jgi:hypothetical protein
VVHVRLFFGELLKSKFSLFVKQVVSGMCLLAFVAFNLVSGLLPWSKTFPF